MPEIRIKLFITGMAFMFVIALAITNWSGRLAVTASTTGEQEKAQQPPAEPTMEQKYKNRHALKGWPASQMRAMMNYISFSEIKHNARVDEAIFNLPAAKQ